MLRRRISGSAKGAHQSFWFISQTDSAKIVESFAKEQERRRSHWTMGLSRHHVLENATVNSVAEKSGDRITEVISCFDRMLFKSYLPPGWSDAMEGLLSWQGLLIKDFGKFAEQ